MKGSITTSNFDQDLAEIDKIKSAKQSMTWHFGVIDDFKRIEELGGKGQGHNFVNEWFVWTFVPTSYSGFCPNSTICSNRIV